jgi:hypothetical protein
LISLKLLFVSHLRANFFQNHFATGIPAGSRKLSHILPVCRQKNTNMHTTAHQLESLQQQTEQFLQKAVGEWQMLPPDTLTQIPGSYRSGAWSAAQCIEHLNIYGRLKLGDTFLFLTAYTERHLLQADRAMANRQTPALHYS